ncbi:MAG TPA: hypothetical protein PK514_15295 [Spirochaetota bacterium]|nr:hypothetical protein [Spirochaetota bacterium]
MLYNKDYRYDFPVIFFVSPDFFIASSPYAYSQSDKGPNIAPEDSSWVYAYAGFGY